MAVAFVANRNTNTSKTAGTTIGPTTADCAAGNLLVCWVSFDNTGTSTPTVSSIDKPGTETASWVRVAQHDSSASASAGGVRGEMWVIKTTVAWVFDATVTFSASITAKTVIFTEFSGCDATVRGTAAAGTSTAGTPSAFGGAPLAGDLVLGGASFESATLATADADTTGGSWSTARTTATAGGGGATNVSTIFQYKIPTIDSGQTYNPTESGDSGAVVVALVPTSTGPSNQTVNPTGIGTAEALGSPTITTGPVTSSPDGFIDTHAVGTPQLNLRVYDLTGVASAEALGTPTITTGPVTASPDGFIDSHGVGSPTVTPGSVTASPDGFIDTHDVGSPTVTIVQTVNPTGIGTAESLGAPTVTTGSVTVSPTGIGTAESLGSPAVTVFINPNGIASGEALGAPTVTSTITVLQTGFIDAHDVGTPTVTATITINPDGFTDTHGVGSPVVTATVTVSPTGIASAEALGSPTVTAGVTGQTVNPTGIASAEALGVLVVSPGSVTVALANTTATDAVGTPTVTLGGRVLLDGIATVELVSSPLVRRQVFVLTLPKRQEMEPRPHDTAVARVGFDAGNTVYRQGGVWKTGWHLGDHELTGADRIYWGGSEWIIDDSDERAELTAAGYAFETRLI